MYYDDQVRKFNFLSGGVLGLFLGTGVALLVGSRKRGRRWSRALSAIVESLPPAVGKRRSS